MEKYEPIATRETLIKALKSDDEGAWTHFYDRYAGLILNFALKRGCSKELAEDVLQETVMALIKHLKNFEYNREKGRFKSLLFKITESKIVDAFRRNGKLSMLKDSEIFIKNLANEEDSERKHLWDKEWENQILNEAIEDARSRVAQKTFQCFEEVFIKGKSIKETAEKLNISPNLASQHKFKVMKMVIDTAKRMFDAYENYKEKK